jgi:hypothetical protein
MSAPKAISTIEREMARVVEAKREARRRGDNETQDWLYGAEVALAWSLGRDVMRPSAAFATQQETGLMPEPDREREHTERPSIERQLSERLAKTTAPCACCGEVVAWVNLDGVCFARCNFHSLADSAEHQRVGDFWKIGLD